MRILREAVASAKSGPIASALTTFVVAGMVFAIMMTTGRTIAGEQQVLSTIDDAGTRTIQVHAEDSAGVKSDILDRLRNIDGIEWSAAFSSAIDATNILVPTGTRVPVRYIFTDRLSQIGVDQVPVVGSSAYLSQVALNDLGLPDIGGAVLLENGASAAVSGRITTPDYLMDFEPVAFIPANTTASPTTVNVVLVIAKTPQLVAPVAEAVRAVIAAEDPTKVTLQTSEALAQLRSVIQSHLGSQSQNLVLALVGVTALLVASTLYGLVMMRRRDFGRRRALGATRTYIITLLVCQTGVLAIGGIILGFFAATIVANLLRDPLPAIGFNAALSILALASAMLAAVVPAVVASRREPIRELRVP